MPNEAVPIRSIVACNGNDEEDIRNKAASEADAIWIDLEDHTHPDERSWARPQVRRLVEELGSKGRIIFVRVNSIPTGETGNDLEAVVCPQLHGIFLPKPQSPRDVIAAHALLNHFERKNGVEVGHTFIYPLMETAESIDGAYEIALASPRVEYMGGAVTRDGDQARAVGYKRSDTDNETLLNVRASVLIKARRAGVKYPISGMLPRDNPEAERNFLRQTKNLGYTGVMCRPDAAALANEMMSPTAEEIARYQEIVATTEQLEKQGRTRPEGYHLGPAHAKFARTKLDLARKLGLLKD